MSLDLVLNLCYYLSLFWVPIISYSLVRKIDWYYIIRLWIAKFALRKLYRSSPIPDGENPKDFKSSKYSDRHFLYATDQHGNSLSLRLTTKSPLQSELFLAIRLVESDDTYTLPHKVLVTSISSLQWKSRDLLLEVLEPFKRLRLTFNGTLQRQSDSKHVHVKLNLIWNACGSPRHYPRDCPTLADSLANERWRDGSWLSLLGDQQGYEQFGDLKGVAIISPLTDDELTVRLKLPSCRSRFWGLDDKLAVESSVHLFVAGRDGTLVSLWLKQLRNGGCQSLKHGNVIFPNGLIQAVTQSDLGPLNLVTVDVKVANGRSLRCVLHFAPRDERITTNGLTNHAAECDLNSVQGRALVEHCAGAQCSPNPEPLLVATSDATCSGPLVVDLTDQRASNVTLTGGKGSSLALLTSLGDLDFVVPPGFVVTTFAFREQLSDGQLRVLLDRLDDVCCGRSPGDLSLECQQVVAALEQMTVRGDIVDLVMTKLDSKVKWAVRSSGVIEDGDDLSAAGQNSTYLACDVTSVIRSLKQCWASLFAYQSVTYRHRHGLPVLSDMAVVIQQMVPSDTAGVLFTCHPTSGNPALLVITANHGLGESVVSGQSDPDTIVLRRTTDHSLAIESKVTGDKNTVIKMTEDGLMTVTDLNVTEFTLRDGDALHLGLIGLKLERRFGSCRDIEWALYEGHVYLLQSRPITSLRPWTDSELRTEFDSATLSEEGVYTVANTGEVFPGCTSTLTISTVVKAIDEGLCRVMRRPGIGGNVVTFDGHVFIDVLSSMHQNTTRPIALASRIVDLTIMGHPVIDERINELSIQRNGLFTRWGQLTELSIMARRAWSNQRTLKYMIREVQRHDLDLAPSDSTRAVYESIDKFLLHVFDMGLCHHLTSGTSVFYQIVALSMLMEGQDEFTNDHYTDIAALLSSCENIVSAEIPERLGRIARLVPSEFARVPAAEGRDWLRVNCTSAFALLDEFLRGHGHRALREFDLMTNTWALNPPDVIRMIQAIVGAGTKEDSKVTRLSLDETIDSLKSPKKESTRRNLRFVMKRARAAVGARETSKSQLVLCVDKLRRGYRYLAKRLRSEGVLPDESLIFHLSHYEIGLVVRREGSPVVIAKAFKRQRLYPKWDQLTYPEINYGNPRPETIDDHQVLVQGLKCFGTPVTSGADDLKARVCVIKTLTEIDQLKQGDILVTYSTDIGWSPYFPMLSGVVTELGGLISHGAVIAREYGLPCIVGVKGVTKVLKTGDVVLLSSRAGSLQLIE